MHHTSFLYITKTTKERSRQQSNFSILCRGNIIPHEIRNKDIIPGFLESVNQFVQIINDSGYVTLTPLTTDEIVGTSDTPGVLERYFSLSQRDTTTLQDIQMYPEEMRVGDKILCLHTLSDVDDLPACLQPIPVTNDFRRIGRTPAWFCSTDRLAVELQSYRKSIRIHR